MNEPLKQQEILNQSPQQNLSDNIEILYQANQYVSKYNQFFNPQDPTVNPTILRFIQVKKYFQEALKQEEQKSSFLLTFNPKNLENLTPYELVAYLKNSGLNQEEIDKVLNGWIAAKALYVYKIRMQGLSFSSKKFTPLTKEHQAQAILDEIEEFKINQENNSSDPLQALTDWDFFYRLAKQITENKDPERLKNLSNLAELLKNEKAKQKIRELIQEKLSPTPPSSKEKIPTRKSKETRKEEYENALQEALKYLRYVYPQEKSWLQKIPEQVINIINAVRESKLTPFVQADILSELFWAIRLNRRIPESLISDLKPKIKEAIRRFEEKYIDHSLHTEAAGFWLEKDLIIPRLTIQSQTPDSLVPTLVEILLQTLSQRDKQKGEIYINVIINDKDIYKLRINPNQDIASQVLNQLSNPQTIQEDDKYQLKQDAYTFGQITEKHPLFQNYFGHKEGKKIFDIAIIPSLQKTVEDDYCIRINTDPIKRPKNHPESLFMVEHHKVQINFDIYNEYVNLAMKFAHKHFDGLPAKKFFEKFEKLLKNQFIDSQTQKALIENYREKIDTDTPLFEAQATKRYDEILADFMFLNEKLKNFNPSFVYALALAIANDIDYFHFLVDGPDIFKDSSEYYSNVQPIVVSLIPIKEIIEKIKRIRNKIKNQQPFEEKEQLTSDDKKKIKEWMKETMEEYQRGKKGLGTPAVIAAPTGTMEKPLSEISKLFHKGVLTLIKAQGMVSVLVSLEPKEKTERIIFHTAKSDVYELPINLANPQNSMGVIGINQSQSINGQVEINITTRKTPSQAQREIKQWIDSVVTEKNDRKITYTIFDKIIKEWEKLISGKITLSKYQKNLETMFEKLPEKLKKIFENKPENLQRQLNFLLQESAKITVDADIKEAIEIIRLMLEFAVEPDDVKSI